LLHIMAHGHYEGRDVHDPFVRSMFTREALLASDWYRERLRVKQQRDIALWTRHAATVGAGVAGAGLARVTSPAYLDELVGTIGADPFTLQVPDHAGRS
jgi:hypothetical protein